MVLGNPYETVLQPLRGHGPQVETHCCGAYAEIWRACIRLGDGPVWPGRGNERWRSVRYRDFMFLFDLILFNVFFLKKHFNHFSNSSVQVIQEKKLLQITFIISWLLCYRSVCVAHTSFGLWGNSIFPISLYMGKGLLTAQIQIIHILPVTSRTPLESGFNTFTFAEHRELKWLPLKICSAPNVTRVSSPLLSCWSNWRGFHLYQPWGICFPLSLVQY